MECGGSDGNNDGVTHHALEVRRRHAHRAPELHERDRHVHLVRRQTEVRQETHVEQRDSRSHEHDCQCEQATTRVVNDGGSDGEQHREDVCHGVDAAVGAGER